MRSLLTIMLLAAAMLPALIQAQTVNICDRTPQVRDQILQMLEADDCAAVDSQEMTYIHSLGIPHNIDPATACRPVVFRQCRPVVFRQSC